MTKDEFLKIVQHEGIRPDAFSLHGAENESYVLEASHAQWRVYYSERGLETGQSRFQSEAAALDDLLARLRADRSVHVPAR